MEAAEAVCATTGEIPLDVVDGLDSLVSKSLLRLEAAAGGTPRVAMLETIHEYALKRLVASGEADTIRRYHATAFVALAEQAVDRAVNRAVDKTAGKVIDRAVGRV